MTDRKEHPHDSMKLTPWFDGRIKPVRAGVYQQATPDGSIGYQRWDGEFWYGWSGNISSAQSSGMKVASHYQNDSWRGLAKDPNK